MRVLGLGYGRAGQVPRSRPKTYLFCPLHKVVLIISCPNVGTDPKRSQKMTALAALHNPDMVAAGKDVIADFGGGNINKRIGAQWRRKGRLMALDDAASLIPELLRSTTKMNAKLVRCK